MPRGVGGKLQDGGTAEPPVGDEEGTLGLEGGAGKAHGRLGHEAHEGAELRILDGEGEERGHCRDPFQVQSLQQGKALRRSAGCDDDGVIGGSVHLQMPGQTGNDGLDGCLEVQVRPVHPAQEGPDDVHGILGPGKDAVVVLEDEGDAGGFEPSAGVFLGKDLQEAFHETFAPGVGLGEGADAPERVREVAATAAGDGDFGKGFGTGLVHVHRRLRPQPPEFGGAETAGGTGSYDGDPGHVFMDEEVIADPRGLRPAARSACTGSCV